jgi:uncharacterized repeat protein (TIGR03803 family)
MGTVYKIDATGHYTMLHSFTGVADGANPWAVILDSAGNLYGTTENGGMAGYGAVYKLGPTGVETVLHSFTSGADGGTPFGGVNFDSVGNLYGTTVRGGRHDAGVVYKLDPTGNYTVLYNFGGTDGDSPHAGVTGSPEGALYGTTRDDKSQQAGHVYKLDATGYTVLYRFSGGADGAAPDAGVVRDSAGNLYGTAFSGGTARAGVVYKLDATGNYTVLHNFTGVADGANPLGGVILDSAGNLYGTTSRGGTGCSNPGCGVVYRLDAGGNYAVLYNFTGGADGSNPQADVVRGPAGNIFGTTYGGGRNFDGVVFQLKVAAGSE